MAYRRSKVKDPSPLCSAIDASKYLKRCRSLLGATDDFVRLTDLLLKIVETHKARDAVRDALQSFDTSDPERRAIRQLICTGLDRLAAAENNFYRAWENLDLIRATRVSGEDSSSVEQEQEES